MTAEVAVRSSDDAIIPSRGPKAWNSTIDLAVDLDQCNYERRCQTVRIPSKWSGMSSAARISSIDAPRHGPTRNRRDSIIMQAMTHVTDRQPLSARWGDHHAEPRPFTTTLGIVIKNRQRNARACGEGADNPPQSDGMTADALLPLSPIYRPLAKSLRRQSGGDPLEIKALDEILPLFHSKGAA